MAQECMTLCTAWVFVASDSKTLETPGYDPSDKNSIAFQPPWFGNDGSGEHPNNVARMDDFGYKLVPPVPS